MGKKSGIKFKFRRHDRIGEPAAEHDRAYLQNCFFDSGDLQVLLNSADPRCIVLGRTGAGKSALLLMLRESVKDENVAWVEPERLSFQYLSNSTIIPQLAEAGVNLDLFYKLLWKHVFATELIRLRYRVRNEIESSNLFDGIMRKLRRDRRKEDAVSYFREWGKKFWEDTEERVKEITKTLEDSMRASLGVEFPSLTSKTGFDHTEGEKVRVEVVKRAQEVVKGLQIAKLNQAINVLFEEPSDDREIYVVVDRLDEDWVDDSIRYRLVRALIDCLKDLSNLPKCKVIISMRQDLLERVVNHTRAAGYQDEKNRSFLFPLRWKRDQLLQMLNSRINQLVSREYTTREIGWQDLLPDEIGGEPAGEYLINRTLMRPRDLLEFFNLCIEEAEGRNMLTAELVRKAEGKYSASRLRSLCDEWVEDYPSLQEIAKAVLGGRPGSFPLSDISDRHLEDLALSIVQRGLGANDRLASLFTKFYEDGAGNAPHLRSQLAILFNNLGLIALKPGARSGFVLPARGDDILSENDLDDHSKTKVQVCPIFVRALGVGHTKED